VVDKRAKKIPLDLYGVQFLHHPRGADPNLVLSVADGRLCFASWQRQDTKELEATCFDIPSGQGELVVSPDDAWIGLAGLDGTLYLWERNGKTFRSKPRELKVSAGPLTRLTFHPDVGPAAHRFVAAVSLDGTASVWTLKGQQLALFRDERKSFGGYLGAEFQRDGQLLLWTLGGSLQQQVVEDLPALIARGCAWLEDYRKGASTPEEDKKSLAFCTCLGPR
jgi:WD40 repeat protein